MYHTSKFNFFVEETQEDACAATFLSNIRYVLYMDLHIEVVFATQSGYVNHFISSDTNF